MSVTTHRDPDRPHVGHLRLACGDRNRPTTARVEAVTEAVTGLPDGLSVVAPTDGRDPEFERQ